MTVPRSVPISLIPRLPDGTGIAIVVSRIVCLGGSNAFVVVYLIEKQMS